MGQCSLVEVLRSLAMSDILDRLRGGDRRSIGNSDKVAADIKRDQKLFDDVFFGLTDEDPVVRMRAADVIEKVTIDKEELLKSHKKEVISILSTAKQQEVCWHMAQVAPRLRYTKKEEKRVIVALKSYLTHKSKIVQTFAMQALADLAEGNRDLKKEVIEIIKEKQRTGSPALQSRARKLLEKLSG